MQLNWYTKPNPALPSLPYIFSEGRYICLDFEEDLQCYFVDLLPWDSLGTILATLPLATSRLPYRTPTLTYLTSSSVELGTPVVLP